MAIGTFAPPMDARTGSVHTAERSRVWRKLVRNPAAIGGALILLTVVGAALFAPYVAPHEPGRQSLIRRFTPPIWTPGGKATYVLGTDQVGRDILSRMIYGARVSLIVGITAVLVSLTLGVTEQLLPFGSQVPLLESVRSSWYLVIPATGILLGIFSGLLGALIGGLVAASYNRSPLGIRVKVEVPENP